MEIEDLKKCKYVTIDTPNKWCGKYINDIPVTDWLEDKLSEGYLFCSFVMDANMMYRTAIFLDINEKG